MSILSGRYKRLLELCHEILTGELELSNKEIASKTGYNDSLVRTTLHQMRHCSLTGEAKGYMEEKFPGADSENYKVRVRPLEEKRKSLLRICYRTYIGDLRLSFKEISETTGFSVESVRPIFNNLKNGKLPATNEEYLRETFPDYAEKLELVKATNQPLSKEEEIQIRKLKIENQKLQAVKLARKLQDVLIKLDKWDETTYDYIDEIHEQMLKAESSRLESAFAKDKSFEHLKKCKEQFEFKTQIYNMALNLLNQEIEIRDEVKHGEFVEHPEMIFCATYTSISEMRSKLGVPLSDEKTDTLELRNNQKTHVLPQEGI